MSHISVGYILPVEKWEIGADEIGALGSIPSLQGSGPMADPLGPLHPGKGPEREDV